MNCTLCGLGETALIHHADANGHRFETLCLAETIQPTPPYRIRRCGLPYGHDGGHVVVTPRYEEHHDGA